MAQVKRRARGAMAPVACVQAVRAAATLPYQAGMQKEQDLMATLFRSSQARALQYCFFAQRAVGKWSLPSGAHSGSSKPRPVSKAAVIGKRCFVISDCKVICLSQICVVYTCVHFSAHLLYY